MLGSFSRVTRFVKAMPTAPRWTQQSVAALAIVTVIAASVLFLSSPVQALCGGRSLAFDAKISIDPVAGLQAMWSVGARLGLDDGIAHAGGVSVGVSASDGAGAALKLKISTDTDSDAQVLKITAGEDTVNLGENAVPLGELKKKPESVEEQSGADRESKRGKGLDLRIEKRKPHTNININIGGDQYGDGKDIVKFGVDIEVAESDTIDGDVVAIGGSVNVDGTIKGDCVSIGGSVNMGPKGVIEGDAVSVGGSINREPGAVLKGDEVVTGGHIPAWLFRGGFPRYGMAGLKLAGLAFVVAKALFVLFVVWLIALIARDRVKVTSEKAKSRLLASFGIGLLIVVLLPIAMVLLCITLIGIPVAILLPFVIVLAGLFGYTAVGLALGYRIFGGESSGRSVAGAAVLGVLLMEAIPIAGKLIGLPGGILWGLSIPVRIIGYALMVTASLIGLGATLLSRFGQAPKAPAQAVAAPGPGAPTVGTAGPVPQSTSVPGYGAPPSGTPS